MQPLTKDSLAGVIAAEFLDWHLRRISIIPFAILYGFIKKTPQGKNQQAQTAQEAALESSQEAHLAEVIPPRALWFIRSRAVAHRGAANGICFTLPEITTDGTSF